MPQEKIWEGGVVGGIYKNGEKYLQIQNWKLSTKCQFFQHNKNLLSI